jgi:hypothetical protein
MGEKPSSPGEYFGITNPNSEYLNPKQIQNPNDRNPKQANVWFVV